jgi:site-specific recombinase XerD
MHGVVIGFLSLAVGEYMLQSKPARGGQKPKLLDQVRDALRARHYSLRTEEAYVQWVRRFIIFPHKRHPQEMGVEEINQFLSDLAITHRVAASTQNQALSAVLFLYKVVLHQDLERIEDVVRAHKPQKLPVVLTREEVKAVLQCLSGPTWLMASLLYGSGLRLLECLRLRVKDIDFAYHQITVRDGKGSQDRVTVLPLNVKRALQQHLQAVK